MFYIFWPFWREKNIFCHFQKISHFLPFLSQKYAFLVLLRVGGNYFVKHLSGWIFALTKFCFKNIFLQIVFFQKSKYILDLPWDQPKNGLKLGRFFWVGSYTPNLSQIFHLFPTFVALFSPQIFFLLFSSTLKKHFSTFWITSKSGPYRWHSETYTSSETLGDFGGHFAQREWP